MRNTTPQALGRVVHARRFAQPTRHGKWLFAPTDGDDGPTVTFHFAMTGALAWRSVGAPRDDHDRVIFVCSDGELRFNQARTRGPPSTRSMRTRATVSTRLCGAC